MLSKRLLLGAALGVLLIGAAPARAEGTGIISPGIEGAGLGMTFDGGTVLRSIETIVIARGTETGGLYPDTQEGDISREKSWIASTETGLLRRNGEENSGLRPGGDDGVASGPKFAPGGGTGTVSPDGGTWV